MTDAQCQCLRCVTKRGEQETVLDGVRLPPGQIGSRYLKTRQ